MTGRSELRETAQRLQAEYGHLLTPARSVDRAGLVAELERARARCGQGVDSRQLSLLAVTGGNIGYREADQPSSP